MVTTQMLERAEAAVTKPVLKWENAPYSNGKEKVADYSVVVVPSKPLLKDFGRTPTHYRYHVRRSSPRSRAWQAKRNGEYFDRAVYSSMEAAMKACEEDALSPKSSLRKQDMGIGDLATAN